MIKLFYIKNKKERNLYIMQEKLKEIINSYPEFSRETVYNIVNEFNKKTLEEKKNQNKEEILESFTVFENDKIYFFEKTVRRCKMLIINKKEDNVLFRYKEIFGDTGRIPERNFSEAFELFEDEMKWYSAINIELSEKIEESDLNFEIYINFCIKKDFMEYFLLKNIMLYLSKKSLVALDFVKALKEVEKYDVALEIPEVSFQSLDFFQHGTMFSMLNEKTEFKKTGKYKKLPLLLLPTALFCESSQNLEFIFDDIIKNKEMYLNDNLVFFFALSHWSGFVLSFLKANKITDEWNIFPEKYFDKDETENKEKIDVIYDIFNILDELEEKNAIKKLVNKKSFEAVEKMKEELSQKLIAKKMKTVKPQKFKINAEFKEVEKALKKHFPSIEMINDEQRLFLEGLEQKNCAYNYVEEIKDNKEILFSLKLKKEDNERKLKTPYGRYTISIKKIENVNNHHFKVTEVKKTANISDEDTKIIFEKISEIIGELNQKIVKEKKEKFNCFIKNIEEFSGKEKIINFLNTIRINISPFESRDNFLVFTEFNSARKIEAEVLNDKININFFLKIFLELSEKDKQNSKKDFEEEIQISFSLKKDGEAYFSIEKINCSYSEKLFSSMINFIFDFFSDKKMMKDIKIIFKEMEEEKKKENLFISLPIPAISYKELINCDSFVSYILSRTETKKTNLKRMDIENLMSNKYAKFFIHHFLFTVPEVNEMPEEEKIKLKAEFLEKYLKHSENFQQLLRDFCGFPLTLAELERQYFEVSGKLEEMGISFEDKDEANRTYFEKLIENIQENSKNIREQNIDLKHLEFSFEGFENENKELFIENLISKPYRIYEATKNFRKTEQFEALNKDLAFLVNKELLEQVQNIPLENSGTVTEFLENFKNEEAKLLKIITTEKEYIENCLILNIESEIERTNKAENVFSIWQVKDTKIKVMLESSLKENKNEIDFDIKSREKIGFEIVSSFKSGSEKFFLEKEVLNELKEKDDAEFEIPEWFGIFAKRHLPSQVIVKNSRILSWASQKFNNDSYEKFKNGNFENKICSFGNDVFFEIAYNEKGIIDIICTRINEEPFSLKEENSEVLKDAQQFYKEVIEEMKENRQ